MSFQQLLCLCALVFPASAFAVYGDARPDAPDLAAPGELHIGVRTEHLVHHDQLDILAGHSYDRPLQVEIWYPATLAKGQQPGTVYTDVLGAGANDPKRPNTPFQFAGRAVRDAAVDGHGVYPLVILSHGYPGSRLQMSYLTEHLASRGYVVVAIDHTDSTRADKAGFASTLLNRPLDDLFVLNQVAAWAKPGSGHFLAGRVDVEHSALIGYSMGGYGALLVGGAGLSQAAVNFVPGGALQRLQAGNPDYLALHDGRIKALVAFAPWGGRQGMFDAQGLAGLKLPTLFVVGDQDDVAGYSDGVRRLVDGAVNADRYLLVYQNARHNVAPNPPPPAASANADDFSAYSEPAWDSTRLNNVNQHFVTAFLDQQLKGLDRSVYLNLAPKAIDGKWAGFGARTAVGMEFYHWPAR
ncbi:alpha/beta hydrolase family protein [Pseudomonas putida]